jgi:hypothetical protein
MSASKLVALACASLLIAGAAQAQTSLFDPPAAGAGTPLSPPSASEAAPAAKPKPRAKPRGPTPARVLTITNDSGASLASLEVAADGKVARLPKALASGESTKLRLPAFKSCTVAIVSSFPATGNSDTHEQDICKDSRIRFTP